MSFLGTKLGNSRRVCFKKSRKGALDLEPMPSSHWEYSFPFARRVANFTAIWPRFFSNSKGCFFPNDLIHSSSAAFQVAKEADMSAICCMDKLRIQLAKRCVPPMLVGFATGTRDA